MEDRKSRIDPVTAQVIGGALENIAIEMGHKLARMSYSSIIRESEDYNMDQVVARALGVFEKQVAAGKRL